MNVDLFGGSVNVWLDAFIRLQLIVLLMTVVVMGTSGASSTACSTVTRSASAASRS